jgi:hypothetical protein
VSEALDALVAELKELPLGKRHAILCELAPAERAAIEQRLAQSPEPLLDAGAPPACLEALSPAMRGRVEAALAPASKTTETARAALRDVLAALSAASASGQSVAPARAAPSLLSGLGRAIGWGRASS